MANPNLDFDSFKKLLSKSDFEEEPVDLLTFCSDDYFLGIKATLSPIQVEIIERMTQVYLYKSLVELHGEEAGKDIWNKTVNEVICEIGKGGGKDFSIKISFARIIYLLHCLKDPLAYFGKGGGEFIDLINIALNAEQAKNIFFDPLKQLLTNSEYFQEQQFEPRAREIVFVSKPIRCFSAHSGVEAWEGYNPIAIVLDEISAFKTDTELQGERHRYSASAIYGMARNSVISRFPSIGKVALLSFPRYQGDFIEERYDKVVLDKERLTREAIIGEDIDGNEVSVKWFEDNIVKYAVPKVWAIRCPSWYTNPERHITDYLAPYLDDPVETMGKFFCMPPKAQQAYFRDADRVRSCFRKDVPRPFDEFGKFADWFKAENDDAPMRFIHIDLGHVRDRAALCMVHCIGFKKVKTFNGTNSYTQNMPIIKMDAIKYWEAISGTEIDFNDVRMFAFDLAQRFPIGKITLDRWQSIDTINIFKSRGIFAEMHSVMKEDYDTLSSTIYDKRLVAYWEELLIEEELLKLQLLNGKKIDHPKLGYKDGADALAGAVWNCVHHTPIEEEVEIDVLDNTTFAARGDGSPINKQPQKTSPAEMPDDLAEYLIRLQTL